jgi:polar amino acid transport system substrate-binding protein
MQRTGYSIPKLASSPLNEKTNLTTEVAIMKSRKKGIGWALVPLVALAMLIASCGSDADSTAPTNSGLGFNVITVATGASYPPDQYMLEDGTIVGWSVDILNAIGEKLGVEVRIENMDFPGILPAIEAGRFDIGSSSYGVTDERLLAVDFVTYFTNGQFVAVAKGNPNGVDPTNVCGKRFAVTQGSLSAITADGMNEDCEAAGNPTIEILGFNNASDVYLAIDSNRADVTVVNASTLGNLPEGIEPIGESFQPRKVGFIFKKDKTELRDAVHRALNEMIADGTYVAILEKWGIEAGALIESEVLP